MMPRFSISFAVPRHSRYIFSARNSSSLIGATSEPRCDVTGMGTIFSLGIAIGSERLTAVRTGVLIYRFPVQLFGMLLPPLDAAVLGTKHAVLHTVYLHQRFSAFPTALRDAYLLCRFLYILQTVPAAKGNDRISGNIDLLCYFRIALALAAQASYFFSEIHP